MVRLESEGSACNLVLVGDGPARERLEKEADTLGLADRVWFYGETYDDHIIGTFLYHSAACVSPGNVGLTAIHSLTFGTPVVTHSDGNRQGPEYEAIEPGISGSLFAENDTEALAGAIRPWLGLGRQSREEVRAACRRIIDEKFNPDRQMQVLRTVFGARRH